MFEFASLRFFLLRPAIPAAQIKECFGKRHARLGACHLLDPLKHAPMKGS
jgi:hypothetical protein